MQVLIAVELRRSPAFDTRLPRRGRLRAKVPGVSRNFEVAFARKARKEKNVWYKRTWDARDLGGLIPVLDLLLATD